MLREQYFNWLSDITHLTQHSFLLRKLFETEFWWTIPFDANRADDGVQLRYRFGRMSSIPDPVTCDELDICPCSMLEMMVALAIRAEEDIIGDEKIGDRTGLWIHDMLVSLGLMGYVDSVYDEREVNYILNCFMEHRYARTGEGGLFTIPDLELNRDMRNVEIWSQLNWFLNRQ